jgi:hypothetical protein
MTGSRSRAPVRGAAPGLSPLLLGRRARRGRLPTANGRPDERSIAAPRGWAETCVVTILLAAWAPFLVTELVFAHSVALLPNKGR